MRMAVQHQLAAGTLDGGAHARGIRQPLVPRGGAALRGMVDQQDAERAFLAEAAEMIAQAAGLAAAEPAGGEPRAAGPGARCADKGDVAAAADEGKTVLQRQVAGHVRPPRMHRAAQGAGHIGIVIAGYHREVVGQAEIVEPVAGGGDFHIEGDVDEVAGDRDVVRGLCLHIVEQQVEPAGRHRAGAGAMPVDVADHTLGNEVAEAGVGHGTQVRVRKMGEAKHAPTSGAGGGAVKQKAPRGGPGASIRPMRTVLTKALRRRDARPAERPVSCC